jgi:hypothetical protein
MTRVSATIHWKWSRFFELMKISKGRWLSCSVPAFSTMSLMVTYIAWSVHRRFDLVGRAAQHLRALELLVHAHDFAVATRRRHVAARSRSQRPLLSTGLSTMR